MVRKKKFPADKNLKGQTEKTINRLHYKNMRIYISASMEGGIKDEDFSRQFSAHDIPEAIGYLQNLAHDLQIKLFNTPTEHEINDMAKEAGQ